MTKAQTAKQIKIEKLSNALKSNCQALVEARTSIFAQLAPHRNQMMIDAMEAENAAITKQLARLGVK